MDGRPETHLNFDTRFGEGPVGLGGQVYQETIGNENNTMIKIGPSFTFNQILLHKITRNWIYILEQENWRQLHGFHQMVKNLSK